MSETIALLERLVAMPTVSRDPNRELIEFIAARRPDLTRDEIAARVREITLEQLGNVDYGEDKRFVEDMGVD